MIPPRIPANEAARLESLAKYDILDTEGEQVFDDLTELAAHICDVPIALISIIDGERQWFKSRVGLETKETPRDVSFCGHAVFGRSLLYVPDATADPRFSGNPLVTGELSIRLYAGEPLVGRDGHALGTLCVIDKEPRELTEQQIAMLQIVARQVTSQLELRREVLERRRLEGLKDEFVSTVSHELRTPLTAIRGTLGLMAGGALGEVPDRWQKPLETASRSAARLGRLIDDILDIEKMAAGRLELTRVRLDMVAVVRDALTDNAGYAGGYGVRFELNALVDLAPVLADFDRIRQVIDNLLSNAAKYGPRRSSVDIDVTTDGSSVTVGVRDHGEGIPADFRDRIFEPFARADSSTTRKRGGTGLGLNIARKIVEDHGGEIGFDSSDEGTRFWFRLDSAE